MKREIDNVREGLAPGQPLGVCCAPSARYEALIEEYGGDFRTALSIKAINESRARSGAFTPSWDERTSFELNRR